MSTRSMLDEHVAIQPNTHFSPQPGKRVPEGALPGRCREIMIQNGTLDADGTVNESVAVRNGWTRDGQGWIQGDRADGGVGAPVRVQLPSTPRR